MDDNTGKGSQAKKKDGRKGDRKVRLLFNKIHFHMTVFQCDVCNKNLKRGESMSKHARSHKFDIPLQCPYSGCNSVSTFHNCVSLPGKYNSFNQHSFRWQRQSTQCKIISGSITSEQEKCQQHISFDLRNRVMVEQMF